MQNNNNDMLCWTHKRAFFFDALKDLKKLPSDDRYGGHCTHVKKSKF